MGVTVRGVPDWLRAKLVFGLLIIFLGVQAAHGQDKLETSQQTNAKIQQLASAVRAHPVDTPIGVGDLLHIEVFDVPELMRETRVTDTGAIGFPLIPGRIEAAGLTPSELTSQITAGLNKFMTNPQVTVIVSQINSQRIYVLGEVTRAGSYTLLPDMTVLQALSDAGGFTTFANSKKIYVLRQENGKQQRIGFNYKDVVSGKDPSQNIALRSGDTIIVP